ncbi:unnamed protein product [Meganyctiphanes norvegica]|uniref:Uncharacterized protein n=1 Tax=Meganyctiphanes norvegica TaxID=48144 RepID=A0AAV2QNU7_MEGNR
MYKSIDPRKGRWHIMAQELNEISKSKGYTSEKCRQTIRNLNHAYRKKKENGGLIEELEENAFGAETNLEIPKAISTTSQLSSGQGTRMYQIYPELETTTQEWQPKVIPSLIRVPVPRPYEDPKKKERKRKLFLTTYRMFKNVDPRQGRWRMMAQKLNEITKSKGYTSEMCRQTIRNLNYAYRNKKENGGLIEELEENAFGIERNLEIPTAQSTTSKLPTGQFLVLVKSQESIQKELESYTVDDYDGDDDIDDDEEEEESPNKRERKLFLTTYMEYKRVSTKKGRWSMVAKKMNEITESEKYTAENCHMRIKKIRVLYQKRRNRNLNSDNIPIQIEDDMENAFGSEFELDTPQDSNCNIGRVRYKKCDLCSSCEDEEEPEERLASVVIEGKMKGCELCSSTSGEDSSDRESSPEPPPKKKYVPIKQESKRKSVAQKLLELKKKYVPEKEQPSTSEDELMFENEEQDATMSEEEPTENLTTKEEIMRKLELWKEEEREEVRKLHKKRMERMDKLLNLLEVENSQQSIEEKNKQFQQIQQTNTLLGQTLTELGRLRKALTSQKLSGQTHKQDQQKPTEEITGNITNDQHME